MSSSTQGQTQPTSSAAIPHHYPHSQQAAATTTTTHAQADAARAIDHTNAWKPSLDRRQSWNKEDQKHVLQMSGMAVGNTGPGFTEKPTT
ncbi:hypothetical protein HRG_008260 [Hirsutella rhossiliensis]|uniref:Uncharacterized protein n=1 Tax=Hirsutella rhossiliensis TaxID=111463 RepID=A0A9P8MXS3_9HYPO|nr:uncharacterized protein HRG_08260 [Hirsutella rhossiliensis]KAH0961107.1 hypothetical protein HRG_08260 [Hirsutella rhossiliensis]